MVIYQVIPICFMLCTVNSLPYSKRLNNDFAVAEDSIRVPVGPDEIPQALKEEQYIKNIILRPSAKGIAILLRALCEYHRHIGTSPLPSYCVNNFSTSTDILRSQTNLQLSPDSHLQR